MAFKMLSALVPEIGLTMDSVYDHLDLLALSIGADFADITGENRILHITECKPKGKYAPWH